MDGRKDIRGLAILSAIMNLACALDRGDQLRIALDHSLESSSREDLRSCGQFLIAKCN